jgi:hypothetical protein
LNPVGYNLVVHTLPRTSGSSEVQSKPKNTPKPKKKTNSRKKQAKPRKARKKVARKQS